MLLLYYVLQLPLPDEYVAERYWSLSINTTVGTTLHVVDTVWRVVQYKADTVIIELSEY